MSMSYVKKVNKMQQASQTLIDGQCLFLTLSQWLVKYLIPDRLILTQFV